MLLKTACPRCNQSYKVSGDRQGQPLKCKKCGETFTLAISTDATPGPPPMPDAPPAPPAMEPQPLRPGQRLGGYSVVRKLGAGGMGEVWLAHDTTLERPAAIKVLPREFARDELRLARFLREAKAAARLDHPNTATVYQAGVEQGLAFIAMQYIDGGSLEDAAQPGHPMPWREATKVICDAAKGLAAAHALGLVHRDVKPSNLMLTSGGTTKVVDFGLARALDGATQLTQQGVLLGTPAYMAPELWMNQEADPRSDVYALACTYYYLLTGQAAFEGPNAPTLGYQHRYEPFPDARQISPHLPEGVCRILARAAAKDPKQRYPTAAMVAAELEALLQPNAASPAAISPAPAVAARQVRPPPASRPKPKRPALAGWAWNVVGGTTLFLVIVLLVSMRGGQGRPEQPVPRAAETTTPPPQSTSAESPALELLPVPQRQAPVVILPQPVNPLLRVWKDVRNNTSVEAEFVILDGSRVELRTTDNTTVHVPLANLSPDDQKLVQEKSAAAPTTAPPEKAPPTNIAPPVSPPGTRQVSTNSLGMKLRLIEAGDFLMGSPSSELRRSGYEPLHRVHITRPFCMGVYEVTQAEFEAVMGYNPSDFSASKRNPYRVDVSGMDTSRFPVENLTWFDAAEFCNRLSEQEGLPPYFKTTNVQLFVKHIKEAQVTILGGNGYRLPTEAEWEYAARAGTRTAFHFGDVSNGSEANVDGDQPYGTSAKGPRLGRTTTVGSYPPNNWGLYDVHGNVDEWCLDYYAKDITSLGSTDPVSMTPNRDRVARGGAFWTEPRKTRSAYRLDGSNPTMSYSSNGFRVARSP